MRLQEIQLYKLSIPFRKTFKSAYSTDSQNDPSMTSTLVVINTADGARGIGTIDAIPNYSRQTHAEIFEDILSNLGPAILTSSPQNINQFWNILHQFEGSNNAKCGLEMAFLDLFGKTYGQSVADLFGGSIVSSEPLNGWIGAETPVEMAREAHSLLREGYSSVKLKFSGNPKEDLDRINTVSSKIGNDIDIRIDVNTGYNLTNALTVGKELENYPVIHFEQPVPIDKMDEFREITNTVMVPTLADECVLAVNDVMKILRTKIADRVKLKILRLGGLKNVSFALDISRLYGKQSVLGHGFCLSPAASAEIQLASTKQNICRPIETVGPMKMADEPFSPRFTGTNGAITVPNNPGLGITISDHKLDKFVVDSSHLNKSSI